MEEPEEVQRARRTLKTINRQSIGFILASMVPFILLVSGVALLAPEWFEPTVLGSLIVYCIPTIGVAVYSSKHTKEAMGIVTAWSEVERKQIVDRLEVESAPVAQLHPLVGQIATRAPELAGQARTLGRQLDAIEREHQTLQATLPDLPEGPTRSQVGDTLERLSTERAAALEALVRLHRSAMEGHHHNEALAGLVSEVPLQTEPPAEQQRQRGTRQETLES